MNIRHLSFAYGDRPVLKDISLTFAPKKITTLLGANGSGKSTLFNCCTRNLRPDLGLIELDGTNIFHLPQRQFARSVAIVHQQNRIGGDITVRELVALGRTPYIKMLRSAGEADEAATERALTQTNLLEVADRPVRAMSGGQRQRVWIAMALCQESEMIFLDEPTTYLDVRYQIDLLKLVQRLNREHDRTIVMVLHDINQALAYSDEVIGLKDGRILFHGAPAEVITSESMSTLYGTELEVVPFAGRKVVLT